MLSDEDVKTYDVNGDLIIAISVPRADRIFKPVYINNNLFEGSYRRNHEGDYRCTEAEVMGMLRDQAEKSGVCGIICGIF